MPEIYIRSLHGNDSNYDYGMYTWTDPYDEERVRKYDRMLHETLSKIFRERSFTSDQIKELLRAPSEQTSSDQPSIFDLLVEQQPALKKIFPERKPSLPWIAILCNYQDSAELLVSSGADVNERVEKQASHSLSQRTILCSVIQMYPSSWNDRFVALLLEHGAEIEVRDFSGKTPLHWAASQGRAKVAKLLLEKGADVNVTAEKESCGCTPLLDAARTEEAGELVPLLIKYGADVTARYDDGRNVLHCLAAGKSEDDARVVEAARVLIQKGVSINDKATVNDYDRATPIDLAIRNKKNELVNLFLDSSANVNTAKISSYLLACVRIEDNTAVLLTLLKRGADIDVKTRDNGSTALHLAYYGGKNIIEILLDVGANVYVKNRRGETPLHILLPKFPSTLKRLALRKVSPPPSVQLEEKRIIMDKDSKQWDYYQDCIEHVDRMKVTKITETCTFFELLTECQCRTAELMRDCQFERKFRQFDLSVFSMYAEDILEAFERAEKLYRSMLEQEEPLNEAVGHILPELHCEKCELKKIVHASRGKCRSIAARLLPRMQCTCL